MQQPDERSILWRTATAVRLLGWNQLRGQGDAPDWHWQYDATDSTFSFLLEYCSVTYKRLTWQETLEEEQKRLDSFGDWLEDEKKSDAEMASGHSGTGSDSDSD